MCLAIPGKLESITSELDEVFRIGSVDFEGIKRGKSRTRSQKLKLAIMFCV